MVRITITEDVEGGTLGFRTLQTSSPSVISVQ